jgi:choice-of-anchor A domain-containing protein
MADNPDSRDALSKLYWSTNGPVSWVRKVNWVSEQDSCLWEGVLCDDNGKITSLVMLNNTMYGTIPSEVGIIPISNVLDFSQNYLYGTVPVELSYMTEAKTWDLGENYLTGTIPCEFGLLQSVTDFNMDFNKFTGTISTWLGLLSSVTDDFELSHNSLIGTIPTELGQLTLLTDDFELEHNLLTGTIPTQLGQLTGLSNDFELQWNLLTGTIPSQLGRLICLGLETEMTYHVSSRNDKKQKKRSQNKVTGGDDVYYTDDDYDDDDKCIYQSLFPDWNLLTGTFIQMDHTDVRGRVQSCDSVDVNTITVGGSTKQVWADEYHSGDGFRVCDELTWLGSGNVFHGVAVIPNNSNVSPDVTFNGGVKIIDDDVEVDDEGNNEVDDDDDKDDDFFDDIDCNDVCEDDYDATIDLSILLKNNSIFFNCTFPIVGNNNDGNTEILSFGQNVDKENTTGAIYLCVDNEQLMLATTINLYYDNPEDAFFVINVLNVENNTAGPYLNMSFNQYGFDSFDKAYQRTVWNFYEAESLIMSGLGWAGTIVAPTAAVECNDGNYNGNLYALSYTGTCEGHYFPPIVPLGLDCLIEWDDYDDHDCDFRLQYNSLTGLIPTELGMFSNLDGEFSLNDNRFTGPLPSQLGLFTNIYTFNIADNQYLCDDIPTQVANLANDSSMRHYHTDGTSLGTRCCDVLPDEYSC